MANEPIPPLDLKNTDHNKQCLSSFKVTERHKNYLKKALLYITDNIRSLESKIKENNLTKYIEAARPIEAIKPVEIPNFTEVDQKINSISSAIQKQYEKMYGHIRVLV